MSESINTEDWTMACLEINVQSTNVLAVQHTEEAAEQKNWCFKTKSAAVYVNHLIKKNENQI